MGDFNFPPFLRKITGVDINEMFVEALGMVAKLGAI